MTVTILLYNEFPSQNLIRREGNDAMVLIITLPFIFSSLGPSANDDFHRQKTLVLRILSSLPLSFIFFPLLCCSVQLLSGLVEE